ncbi:MAG: hypothetical protein COA52_15705 [Hyphomicrobiales bacterium]|nr:MAG: hypothetical protein COA52_15705 [Hyphomicrobiales bacterium]
MKPVFIDGYAIISDNHCIADADGNMPEALRNDADWDYFQAALDDAALTVLGRKGHEANGNPKKRKRLIVSRSVSGIEQKSDSWWWNPAGCSWREAQEHAAPQGGRIAVPGGRDIFGLFLEIGYSTFHLARAKGVHVPGGTMMFPGAVDQSPEAILAAHGLAPGGERWLDEPANVSLTVWQASAN